jgi:hypothetical protein
VAELLAKTHRCPHIVQSVKVVNEVSQPSSRSILQSANPDAQLSSEQAPPAQERSKHRSLHSPQSVIVLSGVSQPLERARSQLP